MLLRLAVLPRAGLDLEMPIAWHYKEVIQVEAAGNAKWTQFTKRSGEVVHETLADIFQCVEEELMCCASCRTKSCPSRSMPKSFPSSARCIHLRRVQGHLTQLEYLCEFSSEPRHPNCQLALSLPACCPHLRLSLSRVM